MARCIPFHRPSRISFAPPHEVVRETTAAFQPRRPSLNLAIRHLRRRLDHGTPFDARAGLLTAPGLFLPAALSPLAPQQNEDPGLRMRTGLRTPRVSRVRSLLPLYVFEPRISTIQPSKREQWRVTLCVLRIRMST